MSLGEWSGIAEAIIIEPHASAQDVLDELTRLCSPVPLQVTLTGHPLLSGTYRRVGDRWMLEEEKLEQHGFVWKHTYLPG